MKTESMRKVAGGSHNVYALAFESDEDKHSLYQVKANNKWLASLRFHSGTVDGLSDEDVLAILIDRLEGFQGHPDALVSNTEGLERLKTALAYVKARNNSVAAAQEKSVET